MSGETSAQQPPPRKIKLLYELRSVRSEQLSKLQAKYQIETDVLDDVKDFAKQRAAVEKAYASGMYKLSCQFLQKREFPLEPENTQDENDESCNRTIHQVWKSLLEETSKMAQSRLASSEVISGQVSDSIKLQKNMRTQTIKKCEELFKTWDEEIQYSIRELARAKKNYSEAEKVAQEARNKFDEATQRLKRGSLKLFQSKTTLEKQCARLNAKRSVCDKRSAHLRNDYLLLLSSANAHQNRLFNIDLPFLMKALDGDTHTRLRKYFLTFCTAEIESSTYAKMCSEKILSSTEKIKKEFHLECFLQANPVFTDVLQYHFDPIPLDMVSEIVVDPTESLYLEREARKWATEVAKMSKVIESVSKQIDDLQSNAIHGKATDTSSDSGFSQDKDPDVTFEKLREYLRKLETTKVKAEAKLAVLRNAGIEVDQWIESAYEAIAKEVELEAQLNLPNSSDPEENGINQSYNTTFDAGDILDTTNYQDIETGTAGDSSMTRPAPQRCISLYGYEAQREDELTILEQEALEIIEESEGDGWIKVRNVDGDSGFIPESYVEVQRLRGLSVSDVLSVNQVCSSELSQGSSNSLTDYEVQAVTASMVVGPDSGRPALCYVRALYDYTGSSSEELSFLEGTIFKVIRREESGVDDGYWEGELGGRIGVFPSLLVEEVDENGSIFSEEDIEEEEEIPSPDFAPPDFAPPDFAPPPLPEFNFIPPNDTYDGESAVVYRRASSYSGSFDVSLGYTEQENIEQARSAPQSPLSSSLKPVRSAPPPPFSRGSSTNDWEHGSSPEDGEESFV